VIGKIVIDASFMQDRCITQDSASNVSNLTVNGTYLVNFNLSGINTTKAVNVTLTSNWRATSNGSVSSSLTGLIITPAAAGTVLIEQGIIDVDNQSNGIYGISGSPTIAGCDLIIRNMEISVGATGSPSSRLYPIEVSGFTTYDISEVTIHEPTVQNSSGSYQGIHVANSAVTTTKCWVYNNTIYGGNPDPLTNASGKNICIGDDADTAPTYTNSINGIWVHDNYSDNMNHQILLGWVTGGMVHGNYCKNGVIGVIGKHTVNCFFSGNILDGISSGGSLRGKFGNGDVYANNTAILKDASAIGIYATDGSTGLQFKNNIIYMAGVAAKAVDIAAGSDATFAKNDYYATAGFANPSHSYQANNYASVAAWVAAQESTALNVDPGFVSYPTDLRVAVSSPLYHAGVFAGAQNRSYRGRPFYVTPTIGAYEVSSRDTAGTRMAASTRATA
jgi:hypothetical protein